MSLRQKIWDGKILLYIYIGEPESIGEQIYLLPANRISYLPQYLAQILRYFERYIDPNQEPGDWWFEFNNNPIPFNRPIGLLHDLHVGLATKEPWRLRLRRGKFPTSQILQIQSVNDLQSYWTNQFKESCYIRDGTTRAVMLLSRENQELLWNSIRDSPSKKGVSVYWETVEPLIDKSPNSEWNVPLRFYVRGADSWHTAIQKLQPSSATLADVLQDCSQTEDGLFVDPILHGIRAPLDVSLGELYRHCIYPDGFLHITVTNRESN